MLPSSLSRGGEFSFLQFFCKFFASFLGIFVRIIVRNFEELFYKIDKNFLRYKKVRYRR